MIAMVFFEALAITARVRVGRDLDFLAGQERARRSRSRRRAPRLRAGLPEEHPAAVWPAPPSWPGSGSPAPGAGKRLQMSPSAWDPRSSACRSHLEEVVHLAVDLS